MSDNNNKNSLKNLFNKNSSLGSKLTTKTYKSSNDFVVNEELEGTEFLKQKSKEINNFKFNVDYSDPANFAKFASAYLYYRDSINYTLDSFPYDGSKEKHQTWRNQSTDLDKYLIDKEWPRYSGYLNMGGDVSDAIDPTEDGWYYGLETVQQYEFIQINGYAENSLYSSTDKKNNTFNLSFADGFTIEFFMRFPSDKEFGAWPLFSPRQPIFSLATDDDFSFNLIFDASSSTVKFGVNYYTSAGGSELPDDGDGFCFIETDMSNSYDIWNHVAVVFNIDNIKVYVNGRLSGTRTFPAVTTPEIITLDEWNLRGLLGVCCKYTSFHGKLWAHLDEFRIWKEPRTEKQINDNMLCNVRGTATELNKESNLSVYYKFNEPNEAGTVIIDYSGRLANGIYYSDTPSFSIADRRVEYTPNDRNPITYEIGDIILYDNNTDFLAFKDDLLQTGLDYDAENGKTLFQRLPSWISEEDSETTEDLKKLTQIMGSYLDNLYIKISFLSKLKQVSYNEIGNEEFYKFAIKNLGFPVIEIFDSADTINLFLDKDNELSFEDRLTDIKSTIYQNLYNNIVPILKTKGTKNSVDALLKSLSIPDNLYNLNFYANTDVVHDNKLKDYYKNVSFLNFNTQYSSNYVSSKERNIFLDGRLQIGFLEDYESNIKIKIPSYELTEATSNLSSSVLSIFDLERTLQLYSLYYVRRNSISNEVKLVANYLVSGSTSYSIETDYFNTKNSYLDIFVGFSNSSNLSFSSILPNTFNLMAVIDGNEIIHESQSLTASQLYIQSFYSVEPTYSINIGPSDITNISTDICVSNFSLSRVSNISLLTKEDSTQGIIGPWLQDFKQDKNNFNQMFLNIDFSTFEINEGLRFKNNCDNNIRDTLYDVNDAETLEMVCAFDMPGTVTSNEVKEVFYQVDKINFKKKENPGEYNIDNDVQVLERDDEFFTKDSRPINVFFNLERSVYGILNDRMMKVFKTFEDFATIYSRQIEFYRVENKNLINLRNELFKTFDSEIDIDRFQEYYKWLDYDLSKALESILPASANSDRKAKNIIESHNLERNKLTKYLLATTTPKNTTNEAILYGGKDLSVVYKSERYSPNPYYSKNWWKYHARRDLDTVSEIGIFPFSSSVDGINDARETFREIAVQYRSLDSNLLMQANIIKPIEIGQNVNFNEGLIQDTEYVAGTFEGNFLNDQTYDDATPTFKKKVLNGFKATLGNNKVYNYKFFEPYRWSNEIFGSSIDDTYYSRSPIKQIKSVMSPFTEKYNNRKYTQLVLVSDPANNKIFPRYVLSGDLNKVASSLTKAKEFALPEEFERIYSTNLTKLTGSQFGNYSSTRENVQYGEANDNNPGFKQALFVASGSDLNDLTQSVIPLKQVSVIEKEDDPLYYENPDYDIFSYGTASFSSKESSYKQRFSAPGDYWNSAFNEVYISPYGTINYRNFKANKYLNTRYALPSLFGGLESGSTTTGSIHKTYRNSNSSSMYYEYDRNNSWHTPFNADLPRAKFDNFFVQHAIPNNIRRYSDLVVFDRSQKVYYGPFQAELYKNMLIGNYVGYKPNSVTDYYYGQEGSNINPNSTAFGGIFISTTNRMYDTIVRMTSSFEERVTNIDADGRDLLDNFYDIVFSSWERGYYNAYFLKLSAPKWVGWTQLRSSNNQIFDYMKKNNLVTKTQITKNWLNPSTIEITENNSFISQSFINFDNHDYEIDIEYTSYNFETGKEEVKKETVYTQKPFKLLNSNKELTQKVLPNLSEFNKIKDNKFIKINKIRYISSLYPKNEYVGLSDIRDKKEWTQTDSSIRLFNRRTFWRDDYNNRLVTSARTSQGVIKDTLSIFSQDGYNLTSENDVGEIFYIKDDNASYSIKPYIQYLSSMALVEFYETSYNRNFSNIFNQTDKRPYFDTYQSYIEGLRKYSSHSIIPEYNISQNTSSIDGRVDQTLLVQNSGTIFESNNFYDYITTNQIVANNPIKAKIKASAIKKLNPYKGFYPAEYTTILAEAFSSSYGDCFSGSFIETLAGANNGAEHTPANNNSTKTGFIGALKTIFGPGVLYNSLKSGLGTDYLLPFSGSTDKTFYNDGRDGLNASLTTLKTLNKLKFEQVYSSNPIIPSKSFFEYDFIGPEKARIIDYRLVKQASNQQFYKKINNFLSETEEFFINKKVINSKKENNFKFKKDNVYVMNINVFKTENYFNIAGISSSASAIELDTFRGSVFGPAAAAPLIAQVGAGILSDALYSVVDFPQENTASVAIDSFASYVHYTPSYYYNAFSTNIILTASKDSYSIDEIFSSASLETILNKNNDLLLFNVYVDNNVVAKNLWPSYNNRNNVENSIDLFNKKYFVKEGKFGEIKTIEENIDNPAWTIEPKFESPLLYFGEIQNYPSGGGMWMDYGTYSDTEGVYLSISDVSGTLSLADAVGFEKKDYRIGELKEQKEIEECLILVPVDKLGNKLFTSEKKDERELILDKYVFPSNLDWKFNKKIRPFIFHAIEFSSVLSRDDLADIWQGLMPSLSYKMEEDDKVLDIDLSDIEKNQIKKGLSYIVFKVKKRARYDFQKYKNGEKDDQRYSYNWPYDYCSLVELCKIDIEIEEEV